MEGMVSRYIIESSLNKWSQVASMVWSARLKGLVGLVISYCKNVACCKILCRVLMDALKVHMKQNEGVVNLIQGTG
jgi:hypothetical protein